MAQGPTSWLGFPPCLSARCHPCWPVPCHGCGPAGASTSAGQPGSPEKAGIYSEQAVCGVHAVRVPLAGATATSGAVMVGPSFRMPHGVKHNVQHVEPLSRFTIIHVLACTRVVSRRLYTQKAYFAVCCGRRCPYLELKVLCCNLCILSLSRKAIPNHTLPNGAKAATRPHLQVVAGSKARAKEAVFEVVHRVRVEQQLMSTVHSLHVRVPCLLFPP